MCYIINETCRHERYMDNVYLANFHRGPAKTSQKCQTPIARRKCSRHAAGLPAGGAQRSRHAFALRRHLRFGERI